MINLLPLPDKESQHKERRARASAVFLVLLLVVEIVSIVILSAPYFLATTKAHIVQDELVLVEQKLATQGGENYTDVVKSTNEKLDYFFDEKSRPLQDSILLARVMKQIPKGVSVTDIAIDEAENMPSTSTSLSPNARSFYVGGMAQNRSSLLAFVDALKKTEGIQEVNLPVSNFTQSTNIDFSVTFFAQ